MRNKKIHQLLSRSRRAVTSAVASATVGLLLAVSVTLSAHAQAPLPPVVSYQGFLTTPAGAPLSGTFSLTFRLYDEASAGSALWQENHPAVRITQGVFNVFLGSIAPLLDDPDIREFDRPFFLSVAINGASELTPRLALASLPVVAQAAGTLSTVTVNCNAGQLIGDAIARAPEGGRFTVMISGDCNENLVIERDFVTLDGGGTATLTGITPNAHTGNAVVYLDGVRSFELNGLTVAGPSGDATGMHGLMLDHVSSATLGQGQSAIIENHNGNGILAQARSQLDLFDSFVRGNRLNGIYVRHSSNADLSTTDVRDNQRDGVFLHRGSSGKFTSSTVVDNGDGVAEPGFCKCALTVDEGSQARILADNIFRSDAAHFDLGRTLSVSRGSSLRIAGHNNVIENTTFDPVNRDAFADAVNNGVALNVAHDSVMRLSAGSATIRGWVITNNLTTVDLRDVVIEGHVGVYGLGANYRMRDQSGTPGKISLVGDIILFGGDLSIHNSSSSQAGRIDGNIDCRGTYGVSSTYYLFEDPEDGYVDCPFISTDIEVLMDPSIGAVNVGGSVIYNTTVNNIKLSPAVEARFVSVVFDVRSADSFVITDADVSTSVSPGSCAINAAGFFNGSEWEGSVTCTFDSIVLSSGTADITVSSIQAELNVTATANVSNGDENFSDNSVTETTTIQ